MSLRIIRILLPCLTRSTLILVAICIANAAQAQTTDSEFARGLVALRSGKLERAAAAFEAAHKLGSKPEALLNLGVVRTRQGKLNDALFAFEQYLRMADPSRDAANVQAVQGEVQRIRTTNTTLVLQLSPADAQISIDGTPTAPKGGGLLLVPGQHELVVTAPGHAPYRKQLNIPAGRFSLALALARSAAKPHTPPAPQPASQPSAGDNPQPALDPAPVNAANSGESGLAPVRKEEPDEPARSCLLGGNTCFSLVGIGGLPNALGVGFGLRLPPYLSIAADAQFLPTFAVDGVDVNARLLTLMLRVHPFEGGFFAGMGTGLQHIQASGERPEASVTVDLNLPTLAFGIGYASEGSGFFIGIDAAILIELTEVQLETPDVDPSVQDIAERLRGEAQDALDSIRKLLPFMFQLNLIRVGYAF